MSQAPCTVTLSLISHTNAGKTTLARTLLSREVGEVRDAAHVTVEATEYLMAQSLAGDRLVLVDTPGFGDSARLARRLALHGNPIGWFVTQVWDRFRDRPLWLAQKAVANVRDRADVVLYLVNAAEDPADAGYLAPELRVLAWIGKPVVVLLNQTGTPRPADVEAADVTRWRAALVDLPGGAPASLPSVLTLDAFARCWPQESVLLEAIAGRLDEPRRAAAERLRETWVARRAAQLDASMAALAHPIAFAAAERRAVPRTGWRDTLRDLGHAVGLRGEANAAATRAMEGLAEQLDLDLRASTAALIAIHQLEGSAAEEVVEQLAASVVTDAPASEGKAAVLGGILSGALTGLVADLASGGLTLGAGVVAGGVLGALGSAGLARGYNVVRGTTATTVRWTEPFLDTLAAGALLRYLAVAHHGRGRGAWSDSTIPPFWRHEVARATAARQTQWNAAWRSRATASAAELEDSLRLALRATALDVLAALYPAAAPTLERLSSTAPAFAPQDRS